MREANIQVQTGVPKEHVKGQSEPLEKVVTVHGYIAGRRLSGLVRRLGESELHLIRDMIKLPEHVQLSSSHLRGVPI